MNDTRDSTPGRDRLPPVSVRPAEMMLRIVRGKYYGHPNPSRDEWVLLGGNPTPQVDPWEVPELPVGTQPEPHFDASLFLRDLEKDKGPSADGVCEWTGMGALHSRLLFCFYTATRGIHTYRVSPDGRAVSDHQPLVDRQDRLLRFGAPLDVVHDRRGWLYVADFSAPERGDSGMTGGVWLVKPVTSGEILFADSFESDSRGTGMRNLIGEPEPIGLGYKTDTPYGYALQKWIVADPHADSAMRAFWCVPERADGTIEQYAQQAGRSKNAIAYANVPVPQGCNHYRIEFDQWCNDNDYIGFIVGASHPSMEHEGIEFGYSRQLPGTDKTVEDAYVKGDLGDSIVAGQALMRRWVKHRIEVDGAEVRWTQNGHLMAAGKLDEARVSGGYFGIRQRFERNTRYDNVVITRWISR